MAQKAGGIGTWGLIGAVALTVALAGLGLHFAGILPDLGNAEGPRPIEAVAIADAPEPAPEAETTPETLVAEPEAPAEPTVAEERPQSESQDVAEAPVPAEPDAKPSDDETPTVSADETGDFSAPTFDVVRVDPDGSATIAGTAPVGATVTVLLQSGEVARFEADASGQFAGFLDLGESETARVLTLTAQRGDRRSTSEDQIILAPVMTTDIVEPGAPGAGSAGTTPDSRIVALSLGDVPAQPGQSSVGRAPVAEGTTPGASQPREPGAPAGEATSGVMVGTSGDAAVGTSEQALAGAAAPGAAPTVGGDEGAPMGSADVALSATATDTSAPALAENSDGSPETASLAGPAVGAEGTSPATLTEVQPSAQDGVLEDTAPGTTALASLGRATDPSVPGTGTPAASGEASEGTLPATQAAPSRTSSVAVLRAGRNGIELLQPAAPRGAVNQVTLDAISYTIAGEVFLAGRARGGSVIRAYLDNRAVRDFQIAADGRWQGELNDIIPGIYTLRIDEVGSDGRVLSRVETPFKRESPEVLKPLAPQIASAGPAAVPAPDAPSAVTVPAPVTDTAVAEVARAPAAASAPEAPSAGTPASVPLIQAVTVQKGDTLWAISQNRYGEGLLYVKVFEANRDNIRDPDLIYPGQIFSIPE